MLPGLGLVSRDPAPAEDSQAIEQAPDIETPETRPPPPQTDDSCNP